MKNTYWVYERDEYTTMFGNHVVLSEKWILKHNGIPVAEFRRK